MINPDAAGIDIGARVHYVCVPEDRDDTAIKSFGCFTEDINMMATWLKKCGIKSVAMESTGVYWIPIYQILERAGFEVNLINAQHVKGVPGRKKTDVEDCSWLQKLHSYGLLRASFRPDDQICVLRSYIRQRSRLIENASSHVLRMQKALTDTSWLGLSPTNRISGAKILGSKSRKVKNCAANAFRLAACSAGKTQTAIGAFMRRIKSKAGAPKAITATARKIACLFYRLLKHGKDYVELGIECYEKKYKENLVGKLEKMAKRLGYDLVRKQELNECVS